MSFTIGIGVLLEESANNRLRELELALAKKSGNWSGLGQPPHITVKVPFEVESMEDVNKVRVLMHDLAKRTKSFQVEIDGYSNFGDKVLYGVVKNTEEFLQLSDPLIDALTEDGQPKEYERGRMIFHSTLATNLSSNEYETALKQLQDETLSITTAAIGLGLFMGIDNLQHWVVINQSSFLQN